MYRITFVTLAALSLAGCAPSPSPAHGMLVGPGGMPDMKRMEQKQDLMQKMMADPQVPAWYPQRERITKRLTELWTYERYGLPQKEGPWFVFSRFAEGNKQPVVYRAKELNALEGLLVRPWIV